ncbi:hypothetical protein B0H11DRAFT_1971165 [Mycena galericulata]|nr:hypothetical protein B0H11DRAFT_1971165 [Mycena galericulata]
MFSLWRSRPWLICYQLSVLIRGTLQILTPTFWNSTLRTSYQTTRTVSPARGCFAWFLRQVPSQVPHNFLAHPLRFKLSPWPLSLAVCFETRPYLSRRIEHVLSMRSIFCATK